MMQTAEAELAQVTAKKDSLSIYRIASKFENDSCYELWPIDFYSVTKAKTWIKNNYPDSTRIGMSWVIVRAND